MIYRHRSSKTLRLLYVFIVGLVSLNSSVNVSFANDKSISIQTYDIPGSIVAFAFLTSNYPDFASLLKSENNYDFIDTFREIYRNMESLNCDIPTRLAFTHYYFVVQSNIVSNKSGFVRVKGRSVEESGIPRESILFVTTPIESFDNNILIILSSVSPERTTVFSVNNKLKFILFYDSFKKPDAFEDKSSDRVGSIYSVLVDKPGYLQIEERVIPGGLGYFPPHEYRKFVIDVSGGKYRFFGTKPARVR